MHISNKAAGFYDRNAYNVRERLYELIYRFQSGQVRYTTWHVVCCSLITNF